MSGKAKGTQEKVPDTGKRKGFAGTDVVRVVVPYNPKVKASRQRFAQYTDKCTVAQYMEKCKALPAPANGKYARADLGWDTERCFIAVYPPEHAMAQATLESVRGVVKPPRGAWPANPEK